MPGRTDAQLVWLDLLGAAAVTSPAWILLTCDLRGSAAWTGAFSGDVPTNVVRNLVELLYFVAGVAVAIVAPVAISFAREQAYEASKSRQEAEKVRLSTVYMTIVDRWNAKELVEARLKLFALVDDYESKRSIDEKRRTMVGDYRSPGGTWIRLVGYGSRPSRSAHID